MSVYSLDHPDIREAESHGSLCRNEIEIIGYCINCGETIISGDEYYVDKNGNKFCTDDCYIKFYEIEKKGNGLWQS